MSTSIFAIPARPRDPWPRASGAEAMNCTPSQDQVLVDYSDVIAHRMANDFAPHSPALSARAGFAYGRRSVVSPSWSWLPLPWPSSRPLLPGR
jgi:hypothetical protein